MNIFRRKGLSERLKGEAVALGLCQQWQGEWKENSSQDELAAKFVRGIDFCIERNWPSVAFVKKHFDEAVRHRWGVYVDETCADAQDTVADTLVLMGACKGELSFGGYAVKDVYVRHESAVTITATGRARVYVSVYDGAEVRCQASEGARVFVYQYGGSVVAGEWVVVRERRR